MKERLWNCSAWNFPGDQIRHMDTGIRRLCLRKPRSTKILIGCDTWYYGVQYCRYCFSWIRRRATVPVNCQKWIIHKLLRSRRSAQTEGSATSRVRKRRVWGPPSLAIIDNMVNLGSVKDPAAAEAAPVRNGRSTNHGRVTDSAAS